MIPNTSFNVSSVQVSQLPLQISQIEGFARAGIAAGTYLQLFDSCIAPVAGAVPLWELPVSASTQFQETLQTARANCTEGIFLGLSTTAGTYTAAATTMDITVWTDQTPLATNVVGDKTTPFLSIKQIWAQNVSNKRLYGLIITELSGVGEYIYINAINSAVLYSNQGYLYTLAANATVKKYFGTNGGLTPFYEDLVNNIGGGNGVLYTGCSIIITSTIIQIGGTAPAAGNVAVLAITN